MKKRIGSAGRAPHQAHRRRTAHRKKRKMRNTSRSSRTGGEKLPRSRCRPSTRRRREDRGPRKGNRDHCTHKCWPWTTAAASLPEGPGTSRETCGRGHPRPQRARGKLYSNGTTEITTSKLYTRQRQAKQKIRWNPPRGRTQIS